MDKELEQKIENRETEIQRAFDHAHAEIDNLEKQISELEIQIAIKRTEINIWQETVNRCVDRAQELGCLHVL